MGDLIALHRRSEGWWMGEFAARAKVTKTPVRAWENDESRPDAELLALVGEWLGIPSAQLKLMAASLKS